MHHFPFNMVVVTYLSIQLSTICRSIPDSSMRRWVNPDPKWCVIPDTNIRVIPDTNRCVIPDTNKCVLHQGLFSWNYHMSTCVLLATPVPCTTHASMRCITTPAQASCHCPCAGDTFRSTVSSVTPLSLSSQPETSCQVSSSSSSSSDDSSINATIHTKPWPLDIVSWPRTDPCRISVLLAKWPSHA